MRKKCYHTVNYFKVAVPAEGASNEWLEQVSDEEYQQLK